MPRVGIWLLGVGAAWLGVDGTASAQGVPPSHPVPQAEANGAIRTAIAAGKRGDNGTAGHHVSPGAEAEDSDRLFNLAQAYRLGRGVPASPARAVALYRQAAAQGHVAAAVSYAIQMYAAGSEGEAMPVLRAAAQGGDAKARYLVGLAHFNGDWLPRDWPRAYALMSLAARTGLPVAQAALGRIEMHLDPGQKEEGLALASILSDETLVDPPSRQQIVSLVHALDLADPGQSEKGAAAATLFESAKPLAVDPRPALAGTAVLRMGAFARTGNAHALRDRLRSEPLLVEQEIALQPTGRLTLVTARNFDNLERARETCGDLRAKGYECVVAR